MPNVLKSENLALTGSFPSLNRRSVIRGSLGIAFASVFGGAFLDNMVSDRANLARRVLERLVGPLRIGEEPLVELIDLAEANSKLPEGAGLKLLRVIEAANLGEVARTSFPYDQASAVERYERGLLTQLIIGTNFLDLRDASKEEVELKDSLSCRSPFARF